MGKVNVLYVSNMDITRVLLALDPNTDNEIAIKAIAEKIKETELCDIDADEYYQETESHPDDFEVMARDIWYYQDSVYLDRRWEATYGMTTGVELIGG